MISVDVFQLHVFEFSSEVSICEITFGDGETSATYRHSMFVPFGVYLYILVCCDGVVCLWLFVVSRVNLCGRRGADILVVLCGWWPLCPGEIRVPSFEERKG